MKRNWMENDVGDMGVGAMIVFIAMVLVAGIAAAVLVQTANRLEIQAMQTGEQTKGEVATGVQILDIEGHYYTRVLAVTYSRIHNMTITVAPRSGSLDVDLATTVVEISNSSVKCLLTYAGSTKYATAASNSGVFLSTSTGSVFDLPAYQFGVIELDIAKRRKDSL